MSAEHEPEFVRLTLEWCNRQRARKGKKPLARLPRGVMKDPASCPCGSATGLLVDAVSFRDPADEEDRDFSLPIPVRKFVLALDNGDLPQYVKKEKS